MPALNFMPRFRSRIEDGSKTITFRKSCPRGAKIGGELKLYTGQRTKNCELIRTVQISQIFKCCILENGRVASPDFSDMRALFEKDGFDTIDEFYQIHRELGNISQLKEALQQEDVDWKTLTPTRPPALYVLVNPVWLINWGNLI